MPSSKNVLSVWSKDLRNRLNRRLTSVIAKPKQLLHKAVEEGDTEAQVTSKSKWPTCERPCVSLKCKSSKVSNVLLHRLQWAARSKLHKTQLQPKAMHWWQQNNWFNAAGFERETAAARAIDVQLDLEGFDKNSDEYYDHLNSRLQKVFPELSSGSSPSKPRTKSRPPVAPTTGGSSSYKGNRVRMSQEQLRMARELGINDEKGLKKYEAEIRRQQRSQ